MPVNINEFNLNQFMRGITPQGAAAAAEKVAVPRFVAKCFSRCFSSTFAGPSETKVASQAKMHLTAEEGTLKNEIAGELRKSHLFKLMPQSMQQKKIDSAVAKFIAVNNSWLSGSSQEIAAKKANAKREFQAVLSPEQQKLSDRIERFNAQVLSGICGDKEVKDKQNEFKDKLIILCGTEPTTSKQYKEKINQDIKNLSASLVEGRAASLKLVDISYQSVQQGVDRSLRFTAGIQSLQSSASLPASLRTIDFTPKIQEFERNRAEAVEKKEKVNAENALATIGELDRLKPKSFDNQCAMLDMIKSELTKGKTASETASIKREIALIKTYIDPDAKENISDTSVEAAFVELKFYLDRDDLSGKLNELSTHLDNTAAQLHWLPEDKQKLQAIRASLDKVSQRGNTDETGQMIFGRVGTRQDLAQINQALDQARNQLAALVVQNVIL